MLLIHQAPDSNNTGHGRGRWCLYEVIRYPELGGDVLLVNNFMLRRSAGYNKVINLMLSMIAGMIVGWSIFLIVSIKGTIHTCSLYWDLILPPIIFVFVLCTLKCRTMPIHRVKYFCDHEMDTHMCADTQKMIHGTIRRDFM
jgi:hypothetical protein